MVHDRGSYEIARQRVDRAARSGASVLDLSGLGLSDLPDGIELLDSLQSLSLARNEFTSLPKEILQLSRLQELNLDSNFLSKWPEELYRLRRLWKLSLASNEVRTIPTIAGESDQVCDVVLDNNLLTYLPESVGRWSQLRRLSLNNNKLTCLPQSCGCWTRLEYLSINDNNLIGLPDDIENWLQIWTLSLERNSLTFLPDAVCNLSRLWSLYLTGNQLSALPEGFGRLTQLGRLYLEDNNLRALPQGLVHVAENCLIELYLHRNPALGLPPEILGPERVLLTGSEGNVTKNILPPMLSNPKRIGHYIRGLVGGSVRSLDEAKVIVVGPGGHGKTSLIEFLQHGGFEMGKAATSGVQISKWAVGLEGGQSVRLNVWDFGGQEIQYSTHQFFLSERAVYVLVYNPRDDITAEQGLYDWVNLIHTIAPESPVILVLSKQDEHQGLVNAADLKKLHHKISSPIPISCLESHPTSSNIRMLKSLISRTVAEEMRHVYYQLPASWLSVKQFLEEEKRDYLSYTDYLRVCVRYGITEENDARILAGYLNDLGTMINYARRMPLEDTYILRPEWVTEGVYAVILAEQLRLAGGRLTESLLGELLAAKGQNRYPVSAQRFIRDMMLQFRLCYELQTAVGEHEYLVPNALPLEEPQHTFDQVGALRFEVHFPRVMPSSVIEQFIVTMNPQGGRDALWRFGVCSELLGHPYLVKAFAGERKIRIWIGGRGPSRARVLELIRQALAASGPRNLEANEYTFPPGVEGYYPYKYQDLLQHERDGEPRVYLPGVGWFSVRTWLDGITNPEHRAKQQEEHRDWERNQNRGGTHIQADRVYLGGHDMSSTNTSNFSINGSQIGGNVNNTVGDGNTNVQSAEVDQRIKLLAEDPAAMRAELEKLRGLIEQAKAAGADEDDTEIAAKALTKLMAAVEAPEKPESKEEAKGALRRLKNAAEAFKEFASIGENWVTILKLVAPAAGMVLGAPGLFEGVF